jgi:NADH-quinone oxidoreductase subunit M
MAFLLYYSLFISFGLWLVALLAISFCIYSSVEKVKLIKKTSLFFSFFQFIIILFFWILSDNINALAEFDFYNFQFYKQWLFLFNFHYVVGIDNISLLFLLLTFFLTPICILIS